MDLERRFSELGSDLARCREALPEPGGELLGQGHHDHGQAEDPPPGEHGLGITGVDRSPLTPRPTPRQPAAAERFDPPALPEIRPSQATTERPRRIDGAVTGAPLSRLRNRSLSPSTGPTPPITNPNGPSQASPKPLVCPLPNCKYVGKSTDSLTRHKREAHTRPHSCKTCGKSFGRIEFLRRHALTHQKSKRRGQGDGGQDWSIVSLPATSGENANKRRRTDVVPLLSAETKLPVHPPTSSAVSSTSAQGIIYPQQPPKPMENPASGVVSSAELVGSSPPAAAPTAAARDTTSLPHKPNAFPSPPTARVQIPTDTEESNTAGISAEDSSVSSVSGAEHRSRLALDFINN
ncbi:hypothetical protein FGG08_006532 [Glutinoglossum americanum]|uniref:C2H2-type domain-containing protein n=1 Tax=Glutinoglossum americanum TaxID=1670608 RepID=A0A9P8I0P1_9PEZI|nr:hypothetical protein FGG08_006532 [Glutinoglossum americanum]